MARAKQMPSRYCYNSQQCSIYLPRVQQGVIRNCREINMAMVIRQPCE